LVFATVFALFAIFTAWRGRAWWIPLGVSVVFLALALGRPALLSQLNWAWTRLGLLLGAIMAPIVMGVIFFGVVTPMGLLARMMGKSFLRLRREPAAPTYWLGREDQSATPESFRNQF
jgi:hypothetical protein